MNPRKFNIAVVVALLLYFVLVVCCCSCSVFKAKQTTAKDSAVVQKKDSGQVTKTQTTENTEATWWREILMQNATANKVPDINLPPGETRYITQPTVYIREGGTLQQQTQTSTADSSWKNSYDSLRHLLQQKTTEKQTDVFKNWWIVAIALGSLIVGILLMYLKGKFTIVKKSTA